MVLYTYGIYVKSHNKLYPYKIIGMDDDLSVVINIACQEINNSIKNKLTNKYIIYQADTINYIPYADLVAKSIPYLIINVCKPTDYKFCIFKGDRALYQYLYDKLTIVSNHDKYIKMLCKLSLTQLNKFYLHKTGKKSHIIIKRKDRLIKRLIKLNKINLMS